MNPFAATGTALAVAATLLAGCDESALTAAAPPVLVFGRTGMGPGEFSYPRAAVAAPDHRLYVVDKAGRIQCLTYDGQFLYAWKMPQIEAGKPTGLGIGPGVDGRERSRLYVADTHYSRVIIFDPEGRELGRFGSFGKGPAQFILPTDVAVDQAGCIYVSEYGDGNDRVSKFSRDEQYLGSFGGPDAGEAAMLRPQSLLIDRDGTIWVADACHHRICRFDADGAFLGAFGRPGSGLGELRFPYGIDMLSDGSLVVSEYGNNRIQRFDREGHSLGAWGAAGREPGQLAYPWALVVGDQDRILIVDSGNNRVQVIEGLSPRTWRRPHGAATR